MNQDGRGHFSFTKKKEGISKIDRCKGGPFGKKKKVGRKGKKPTEKKLGGLLWLLGRLKVHGVMYYEQGKLAYKKGERISEIDRTFTQLLGRPDKRKVSLSQGRKRKRKRIITEKKLWKKLGRRGCKVGPGILKPYKRTVSPLKTPKGEALLLIPT